MKKMKWIMAAALLFFGTAAVNAQETAKSSKSQGTQQKEKETEQDDPERDEKIDKLKIAFITTELGLTTSEAEKFWPIWNEQEAKLKELRKSGRESHKNVRENFDALSDADAKKQLDVMWDNHAKENAIRKEYSDRFTAVIGAKRTLKLMSLEHEFRRELLDRLKDQHHPHDGPPKHHGQPKR